MRPPATDAFERVLERIGGTRLHDDTFTVGPNNALRVTIHDGGAHIAGGADQPAFEQQVVSLARLCSLRVILDRDVVYPPAPEEYDGGRAVAAPPQPVRHVRRGIAPIDEAFRRIPDLQRITVNRGRVAFATDIAAEIEGSARMLTMYTNELPETSRTALALLFVQVLEVCDRSSAWLRVIPRDVPNWLHRTLRSNALELENPGNSYLRAPRPI